MGSYIAFRFLVDAPHAHAIEPLFKHEHIGPVALGGLRGTDGIILAGWALEHFLTEYANDRTRRELRRVELAPTSEGDELRY